MKVIKIDTNSNEVYEIEIEPTLEGMYAALECDIIQRIPNSYDIPTDTPHDLWLDEEGLLKTETQFFALLDGKTNKSGFLYRGHGIITGCKTTEEGQEWSDHSADINKIRERILFMATPERLIGFTVLN